MKNVIITILSVLVLGLSCFIIYDKVINKEEKEQSDTVSEKSNKIIDYSEGKNSMFKMVLDEKGELKIFAKDYESDKEIEVEYTGIEGFVLHIYRRTFNHIGANELVVITEDGIYSAITDVHNINDINVINFNKLTY